MFGYVEIVPIYLKKKINILYYSKEMPAKIKLMLAI